MTPDFIRECVKHPGTCYFYIGNIAYTLDGLCVIDMPCGSTVEAVLYRMAYRKKGKMDWDVHCTPINSCADWNYHMHHTITGPGGCYR